MNLVDETEKKHYTTLFSNQSWAGNLEERSKHPRQGRQLTIKDKYVLRGLNAKLFARLYLLSSKLNQGSISLFPRIIKSSEQGNDGLDEKQELTIHF